MNVRKTKKELLGDQKRKPANVVPDCSKLPDYLKRRRQFLFWRWEWDVKRNLWDKPPYSPRDGAPGGWQMPDSWGTITEAVESFRRYGASGIGYAMQPDADWLVAIDLDDCVDAETAEIIDWPSKGKSWKNALQPRQIMAALGGYWEISVSGTGLRGFVFCPGVDVGRLGNKSGAEFYIEKKYLTLSSDRIDPITGERANGACQIETVDAELLNGILAEFGESKAEKAAAAEEKRKARKQCRPLGDSDKPTAEKVLEAARAAKNADKFNRLWQGDLSEYNGDHSAADSALICMLAFYCGPDEELIDQLFRQSKLVRDKWDETHDSGGATYGEMTIANALGIVTEFYSWAPPPCVTNVGVRLVMDEESGEQKKVSYPLSMQEIVDRTRDQAGDWPRRVGTQLFVDESHSINWLGSTDAVYGYLHSAVGRVTWAEGPAHVRRGEFVQRLTHTVTSYDAIEVLPHFPQCQNTYYAHPGVTVGDGSYLRQLGSKFSPATEIDRDLILASFVTPFWGGPGGARPAFVITSDFGRGVGKTTLMKAVGRLCGGLFDFSNQEDTATIKKRLLTKESATTRICAFDNIKTSRLSWAELEAFITCQHVSGHCLYAGERTRPNTLQWMITLNGPALSKDMAQRSVIIKLDRPNHSGDWEADLNEFIDRHRWQIIGDIAAFFQQPAEKLEKYSRWGYWEREVLARLPEPNDAQRTILERQAAVDCDGDDCAEFEEYVAGELERLGYDIDLDWVNIPGSVARDWWYRARGERASSTAITRHVKQWCAEGTSHALSINPSRTHGRGFRWSKCPNAGSVFTDLEDRLRDYGRAWSERSA